MSRRALWRRVLDAEVNRWSALSPEALISALRDVQAYEVEADSQKYQVEVELLEDPPEYLHVMIAVDDGGLPSSIVPATRTFIREKAPPEGSH